MQFNQMGGPLRHVQYIPSQATLGTDDNWPIWQAPSKVTVTGVTLVPAAAVTADGTNYSIYTATRYTAGGTATSVATRSWIATDSANHTPEAMTLSATAANLILASGDTLEIVKTHSGNGLVIPDMLVVVNYTMAGV